MAAVIRIEVQTSGGLDAVKKDVRDLGKTAESSGGGFNALQEIATGALRKIGEMVVNVGAMAFQKFGEVIGDSISAAKESNMVAAQTAQVIKSTGSAAGVTAQHVLDYASALSAASGKSLFGDEQIAQSTNLLLTFTNIKGATLDAATAISVDMAQALGGAPKDAAIQLGKALNDPLKGITALTRVGVTFTKEQKATIQAMQEAGDTAGAQAIILAELNKEFGGSAAAAAAADGGFAQFQDRLGEMEETIGKAILPILGQLMGVLNDTLLPVIENAANQIGPLFAQIAPMIGPAVAAIEQFGRTVLTALSPILSFDWGIIQQVGQSIVSAWLGAGDATDTLGSRIAFMLDTLLGVTDDIGPIESAFDAISMAIATNVIPAFQAVWTVLQTQVMPILNDLASVVIPLLNAAVQVLAGLWFNVLAPSLQTVWMFITSFILPILAALAGWLKDNLPGAIQAVADWLTITLFPALHQMFNYIDQNVIPILALAAQWLITNVPVAIQAASDFFNNTLVPALNSVWAFIQNNVIPIFTTVASWLQTTVPAATQTTSSFWTGTLLPALNSVWAFIQNFVIPLFTALVQIHMAVLGLAVRTLTAVWQKELLPALTAIWTYINTFLGPIFQWLDLRIIQPLLQTLKDTTFFVLGGMIPFFELLGKTLSGTVASAFEHLSGVGDALRGSLKAIGAAVQSVISWLSDLADKINSISVPSWLEGHSPPPMANWFSDIGGAIGMVNQQLPDLAMNLAAQVGPGGQSITNTASTRSFTYAPQVTSYGGHDMPMDLALASSLAGV